MSKLRWALVGTSDFALDWIGASMAAAEHATLAAVVSRSQERGQAAARRLGVRHAYTGIEQIDRAEVDGVFLVVPNDQHAPLAIAAAQRGLHVVVEKPMAPTMAECHAMREATQAAGVTLAVAHCMEWSPSLVKARELLAAGTIGTLISASIGFSFDAPGGGWRQEDTTEQGGGPLFDVGVHAIDALVRLLGPVAGVTALLSRRVYHYPPEDTSTTLLEFASGVHGVVQAHFNCAQNSLELQGTGGRITSREWLGREFAGDLTLEEGSRQTSFQLQSVNVYTQQIDHVSQAIKAGDEPIISAARGAANIAVVEAAIRAARTGARQEPEFLVPSS